MTSYTDVTIIVLDVNDEPPKFPASSMYRFEVSENEPAGTEVGSVSVTDNDLAPFNKCRFALMSTQYTGNHILPDTAEPFSIQPETGLIVTSHELDREKQPEYQLVVIATDVNKPDLSSTTTVTVIVGDVDDNRPVFVFPCPADSTIRLTTWQVGAYCCILHL